MKPLSAPLNIHNGLRKGVLPRKSTVANSGAKAGRALRCAPHGAAVVPSSFAGFLLALLLLGLPGQLAAQFPPPPPVIQECAFQNGNFQLSFQTVTNQLYTVACTTSLAPSTGWQILTIVNGNGSLITVQDTGAAMIPSRYYSLAVGQVCSVNTVGYLRRLIQPGTNLVANPFSTANSTIGSLLPNCPDGSQIYKNFGASSFCFDGAWDQSTLTLSPGEGAVLVNPSTAFEVVFAGEVPQGTFTTPILPGMSLMSLRFPANSLAGFPAQEGDVIQTWNASSHALEAYEYWGGEWWNGTPVINPGEAFFYLTSTSGTWTQNYTVNCPGGVSSPFIYLQPASRTNNLGTSATFTVGATGTYPLSYQWRCNGTNLVNGPNISGATAASLTIAGVQDSDAGFYRVVVSNAYGVVTSAEAQLTVTASPPDATGSEVVAWGENWSGQTNVPVGLSNIVAVAAGGGHCLALREDGTVAAWGGPYNGATNVPVGLSSVVAAAAGWMHSVALRLDGTVTPWGDNQNGQTNVPAGFNDFVAVAAGGFHSLALRADGTVVAWGGNHRGQTNVPTGLSNVVAVAGGIGHSLALRADGTMVAWGQCLTGTGEVPATVPAGLSNVVAIACGMSHSLALKADGTVTAWGLNTSGQTNVPAGLSNVIAVAGGGDYSLALRSDGTVIGWGDDTFGQTSFPANLSNVVAISASRIIAPGSGRFGLALTRLVQPRIHRQPFNRECAEGTTAWLSVEATGTPLLNYQWRFNGTNLVNNARVSGADTSRLVVSECQTGDAGLYSVVVSNTCGSITSAVATLTVRRTDSDGDGLPDSWELANGLNPDNPADAQTDLDGDGMTNLQEYLVGTDPQDASSCFHLYITRTGGNIVLTWPAGTLQAASSAESGVWLDIPMASSPTTLQAGSPQQFFRAVFHGSGATVYSVNIVGYINRLIPAGLSTLSNPLSNDSNSIALVIPNPPDGTVVFKQGVENWYTTGFGWDYPDMVLAPGETFELSNASGGPFVNMFVGEFTSAPTPCVSVSAGPAPGYPMDTPLALHVQSLNCATGNPIPNVAALVRITTAGTTRTNYVTTDATGQATFYFDPLAGEAGLYEISASLPNQPAPSPQDTFSIVGVAFATNQLAHRLIVGQPITNTIELRNLSDVPLSGLAASLVNPPPDVTFQATAPGTLPARGTSTLTYVLKAMAGGADPVSLIRVTSAEGATNELPVTIEIAPPAPLLVVTPASLSGAMLRGSQSIATFNVANVGGASSGDLDVLLPNDPSAGWLRLVTPPVIPALAPNEQTEVTVSLTPSNTLPLGPYSGAVALWSADAGQTDIPFQFQCVSALKGSLRVSVMDEFTYYAAGAPKVTNATVTLFDPYVRTNITSALTDADGVALFTDLTEAYYGVTVSAPRHGSFTTVVLVPASQTFNLTAFLARQMVSYQWIVSTQAITDRYLFTLDVRFETEVPAPVLRIEPGAIDLCQYPDETNVVNLTVYNSGLITAKAARLFFGTHPRFEITPLTSYLGDIPGQTNCVVPVTIRRLPGSVDGPSSIEAHLDWELPVGNDTRYYRLPIYVYNACLHCCDPGSPGSVPVSPPTLWSGGGWSGGSGGSGGTPIFPGISSGTSPSYPSITYPPAFPPPVDPPVPVQVGVRLSQSAVLTREAFTAFLAVTNGCPDALTSLGVVIEIRDSNGQAATDRFGIRPPDLAGLDAVDGTGTLAPFASGSANWTVIPATNAAPTGSVRYTVGGKLTFVQNGASIQIPLFDVPITVFPDARLAVDYFWEREVFSDDPFTPGLEPAVPFGVGLRMKNAGLGKAIAVQIISAQPQIVDNKNGLLIDFKLLSSQIGSQPVAPTLTANLGDINPGSNAVAIWWMTASLQGRFTNYNASFTHLDDLGNGNLSLVDSISNHPLVHVVRADRPTDDLVPDFLVSDGYLINPLPDRLYLSDGSEAEVAAITNGDIDAPLSPDHTDIQLTASVPTGWVYLRIADPGHGAAPGFVKRSDGRFLLLGQNVWTTHRIVYPLNGDPPYAEDFLHILDFDSTGSYTIGYHVALYIVQQPQSLTNLVNTTATFTVQAGGTDPITYQWLRFGTNLPGQTDATLTITNVQTADQGSYQVIVSNLAGALASDAATLAVWMPPVITSQPRSVTNLLGTTATFTVQADGTTPFAYQWLRFGTNLPGQTDATLTIANLQLSDEAPYAVIVSNAAGSVTSAGARLFIWEMPHVVIQPADRTNGPGTTATFSVGVTGAAPLGYQWSKGNQPLADSDRVSGATTATLTLSGVQPGDMGNYSVVVTNSYGMARSRTARLQVFLDMGDPAGGLVAYYPLDGNAQDASGNGNDGTMHRALPGEDRLGVASGACYFDGGGSYISAPADRLPTTNRTISLWFKADRLDNFPALMGYGGGSGMGKSFLLGVNIGGYGSFMLTSHYPTYYHLAPYSEPPLGIWYHLVTVLDGNESRFYLDGEMIGAQTGSMQTSVTGTSLALGSIPDPLGVPPYSSTGIGFFTGFLDEVRIYDRALSDTEILALYWLDSQPDAPAITTQPRSQTNAVGSVATFTVGASGTPPLRYQWRFDGTPLVGATNSAYVISDLGMSHAGSYDVVVTNLYGSITSGPPPAVMTVVELPVIIGQPQSRTNPIGSTATFTVSATGTGPLSYRWSKGNEVLTDSARVSGATNALLTVSNIQASDMGSYSVTVANDYGTARSQPAHLSVFLTANDPVTGLVAYYPLNGDARDVSDNANHGTMFGVVPATDRFGVTSGSCYFAGNYNFISASADRLPSGNRTVSLWFKADRVDTRPGLLGYGGSGVGDSFFLGLNHWGSNSFVLASHYWNYVLQAPYTDPPVDRWYHWVTVMDDAGSRFYLDGEMIGSRTGTTQTYVSGTSLALGTIPNIFGVPPYTDSNVGFFTGCLDEVRIYDRALSAEEILALYWLNSGGQAPSFASEPQDRTNVAGSSVTFSVAAAGTPPLTYQWWFNGTPLAGATGTTFTVPSVQAADAGLYSVIASNLAGSAQSREARLIVVPALPQICPVADQFAVVGSPLVITNCTANMAAPVTFNLGPSAPTGASLTPEGVFSWTPQCDQGSTTNRITIQAIDSGSPPASNSLTFTTMVFQCIETHLGNGPILAGDTNSVSLRLLSAFPVTNMTFKVVYPAERLTNFALAVNSSEVLTQNVSYPRPGEVQLTFTVSAVGALQGPTTVGQLGFAALPSQDSAFVPLAISDVTGLTLDGRMTANASGLPGRLIVIGPQPVLEASSATNKHLKLTLYGNPAHGHVLEWKNSLFDTDWQPGPTVSLTNLSETIELPNNGPAIFYRAFRQ